MKTIKCQHCEQEFTAANQDDVLQALLTHYKAEHYTTITTIDEAGKKAWMEQFAVAWGNAPEQ